MKRALASVGFACLALFGGLDARADVVGPPPSVCPEGASPTSCHGGPLCAPLACDETADCAGGTVCKEQPFCVTTVSCGGLIPPDADIHDYDRKDARSTCPNGDECTGGATCESVKVCLLPWEGTTSAASSGGTPASSGGCSCRVPGVTRNGRASAIAALVAIAAGAALLSRRARR